MRPCIYKSNLLFHWSVLHLLFRDNLGIKREDIKGFILPSFMVQKTKTAMNSMFHCFNYYTTSFSCALYLFPFLHYLIVNTVLHLFSYTVKSNLTSFHSLSFILGAALLREVSKKPAAPLTNGGQWWFNCYPSKLRSFANGLKSMIPIVLDCLLFVGVQVGN